MDKHENSNKVGITIVGAGLVGSLLSIYLSRRGYAVDVYERRPDPRIKFRDGSLGEGRSINLAISERGLNALEEIDLDKKVKELAIPMYGRTMHDEKGELTYQAYGKDKSQYINSISRGWLNCYLLDQAESTGKVQFFFNHNLEYVDFKDKLATYKTQDGELVEQSYVRLIGTDGSSSAARKAMESELGIESQADYLSHGYKEFVMSAKANGDFKIDKNSLHIWPRGPYMMIALPNFDGSYTCTLFLAHKNEDSSVPCFEKLKTKEDVQSFFTNHFPDFCELVPDYMEQEDKNPIGGMVTLKCGPWNYKDEVLLMGDSSHAIVPFFGQGMNSGFEDVFEFDQMLGDKEDWENLFSNFYESRKKNADAIADMALENFVEMSAKTADKKFLYQKKIEKELQVRFPDEYVSRYSMVSFTQVPYSLAMEAGFVQFEVLSQITEENYPNLDLDYDKIHRMMSRQLKPVMEKINSAQGDM